jgi:hypothetical protein
MPSLSWPCIKSQEVQLSSYGNLPRFPLFVEVEWLCSHGQSLLWGNAVQDHIGAVVIGFPHPLGGVHLNLFKVGLVVLRQPFITHRSIEPLDVGVLPRRHARGTRDCLQRQMPLIALPSQG